MLFRRGDVEHQISSSWVSTLCIVYTFLGDLNLTKWVTLYILRGRKLTKVRSLLHSYIK